MDPFLTIFSQPPYESLALAFEEATCNGTESQRNPSLVKKARQKNTVLTFCAQTEQLLRDTGLWNNFENTFETPRVLRFRQFIIGNIVKSIFVLHKEKAKRLFEICRRRFLRVFRHPFNKKLDEVIVLKKIYPAIPALPAVRFHQKYDKELWDNFYEDSRMLVQADVHYERVPDSETIQADGQVDEAASVEVPAQVPQPVDLFTAPVPMDIDRDFERDLDQLVPARIRSDQLDLDGTVGEYPRETTQDDRPAAEPTLIDHLIADLLPDIDAIRAEMDAVRLDADITRPEADVVPSHVETVRPEVETVPPEAETVRPEVETVPPEVEMVRPVVETVRPEVDTRRQEADMIRLEAETVGPEAVAVTTHVDELQTKITQVTDSPPIPAPQPITVTVDVHFSESIPEPPVAIRGDRLADEAASMDHLIADLHPAEDVVAHVQMDVVEHDPNQPVSVGIRSEQPDQIVAEVVREPVEESVQTEQNTGEEAEINIQQLQQDFDRIELVGVDEIEVGQVDDIPTSRPDQLQIPGIVVTELEKTRTDLIMEPEIVPETGPAEELMEVVPQQGRETRTIRISDLMREDGSWEKARQKRAKRKIPVFFTPQQMKRMINRPLVKSADQPTLAAEIYAESRPNVLNPLRLLLQEPMDIHDVWDAPTNYADELKKYQQKESKFTLRQMIPFSHGVIFERIKPGYMAQMTEKEMKDRETGRRALGTLVNFPKIPSQVILRFYGEGSPSQTRSSFRHVAENQQLDIPDVARKSSVTQPRESHKSLAPDAAVPSRPSIEPYLAGEVLGKSVQDESIIVQLPPPEQVHITVPEEELNLTAATRETITSAPAVAIDDSNRLEFVEARPSLAAPSRLEVQELPPITAPEENLNRIEVLAEVTVATPAQTTIDDMSRPEVQQPRPSVADHIGTPRDELHVDAAEKPRDPYEIHEPPLKRIVKNDVLDRLKRLFRQRHGKITFLDLCPDDQETGLTRNQAAQTLIYLMELHVRKTVYLEYELEDDMSESQILIFCRDEKIFRDRP